MLCLSLGVVSVLGIILAFYLQMPLEMRRGAYDFFDGYNICMITELTGKVTRIFFNSGSRLFFAGFALSIVFSLIENKRKIIWIFIASLDIFGVFYFIYTIRLLGICYWNICICSINIIIL